jgi:hypothetical protein
MIADSAWSNLVGVLIGAGIGFGGILLTLSRESARDRTNDARKLRDARIERIRADTVTLAVAADAYEGVGKQLAVLWAGDTKEARAERLTVMLTKAADGLIPAVMRLQTETGTAGVVDTYKAVLKAFVGVHWYPANSSSASTSCRSSTPAPTTKSIRE